MTQWKGVNRACQTCKRLYIKPLESRVEILLYTPRAAKRVRVCQMELCERGVKRKFLLWKSNDQVSKGVGLKGVSLLTKYESV